MNNDHLSTVANILGSQGWSLYTGLNVPNIQGLLRLLYKPTCYYVGHLGLHFNLQQKVFNSPCPLIFTLKETFFDPCYFIRAGDQHFFYRLDQGRATQIHGGTKISFFCNIQVPKKITFYWFKRRFYLQARCRNITLVYAGRMMCMLSLDQDNSNVLCYSK